MQIFYDLGIQNRCYWGCYVLGFIAIFVFNGFYAKKYNIPAGKAVAFTVVSYIVIYAWAYVLAWVVNNFTWGHHNAIRVFAWMPLVLFLMGKIFKISFEKACDFITPSTCLVYGIARLGCNFTGCCYGISASWGIFSRVAGHRCFPVQLCQSITSLIIFAIVLCMAKKKNYKVDGLLYPYMLIMYGGVRFLLDFLQDNDKLLWKISELALWGLVCVIVGVVWLLIKKKLAPAAETLSE